MNPPTEEQLRHARRQGAANALSHIAKEKKERLLTLHAKQDDRREKNIRTFVTLATAK